MLFRRVVAMSVAALSLYGGASTAASSAADFLEALRKYDQPPPPDLYTRPCQNHPDMDLAAYVAAAVCHGCSDKLYPPNEIDKFVPKGLTIENGPVKYVVIGSALHGRSLPIEGTPDDKWESGAMNYKDPEISPCRVRDGAGKVWVVRRSRNLGLTYFDPGEDRLRAIK